jgi:NADP-dependent 3-hydroxy acid dehydrogenase YdfG
MTKVVAITGASSGIGRATARYLAGAGARVVLGARRTDRLAELCSELGANASFIRCDVTSRADLEALVAHACDRHGGLDVLVNNAGIARIGKLDELRVDDWDAMIDVNFRGVLYGIAAALPIFRAQQRGHIVNVVSTSGLRIVPTQGVYAATKNAVRTLSEALRQEAGKHLRVTVVSPGFVKTELVDSGVNGISDPAARAAMERRVAELAIEPDAIARAIAFAIDQPPDVDVGDIVVRPTAQD